MRRERTCIQDGRRCHPTSITGCALSIAVVGPPLIRHTQIVGFLHTRLRVTSSIPTKNRRRRQRGRSQGTMASRPRFLATPPLSQLTTYRCLAASGPWVRQARTNTYRATREVRTKASIAPKAPLGRIVVGAFSATASQYSITYFGPFGAYL